MNFFGHPDNFEDRHIGPSKNELNEMLKVIGADSLDQLIEETIPSTIRLKEKLSLDEPLTEYRFIEKLKQIAKKNKIFRSYIGMGYYNTVTPAVIQRGILENPGWYTQYTPYQAEIAQGRLEALLVFQTMVEDLTGLPIANASLLDEGTAAAEAMQMFYGLRKNKAADTFFVSQDCFPQTIDVLKTRSNPHGIKLQIGDYKNLELNDNIFGILVQYPSGFGEINDYKELFSEAKAKKIFSVTAADLLSLALITSPGELGADCAIGNTQRFGIPMGYGGPHAAYFAVKEDFKRFMPGRIIGVSVDVDGQPAYRMALQTREQHIRREKATSNICTAQALLASMAAMYAVYHGPEGIKKIAVRTHKFTKLLNIILTQLEYNQTNKVFFDTLKIEIPDSSLYNKIKNAALEKEINLRYINSTNIGISLNETTDLENLVDIIYLFAIAKGKTISVSDIISTTSKVKVEFPLGIQRESNYLSHKVFNTYHSETDMMRYLKSLENKDLSLVHSMTPLGSCTMKLNATSEMLGITWPEFAKIHPFAPKDQVEGYRQIIHELEADLCKITGFNAVSFQPNSGAQGEYSGLMVIKAYQKSIGEGHRNIILIPSSAHGTNPASAIMAGNKIVIVNCDKLGNVDVDDLKAKAEANKDNLAALMVTYPSTHGVFEEKITEICEIIHKFGGQVYMDGANMNAQVGLTSPAMIGADICHLNLHKTFAIPHGGGGPGEGPIAAAKHLAPFLPKHSVVDVNHQNGISAVSSAPYGSALILIISYAYIKMMGGNGLANATKNAILNANYIKAKLEPYYKVLYSAKTGRVAHELIFDMHEFKNSCNIEAGDIAKRLMDYGYHAPTVSFPVHETLMIEPTESESKKELDKFCDALILIKQEILDVQNGKADLTDNVLKNCPHTAQQVTAENWQHKYSRQKAVFPAAWSKENKFWPSIGRINNAVGDRNLVCSCIPFVADPLDKE